MEDKEKGQQNSTARDSIGDRGNSLSELASEFAHGSLLEQYAGRLEQAESLSPQQFIEQLGSSIDQSQIASLVGELESVRLTFEIGERMRRANPTNLFGTVEKAIPTQIGDYRILREIGRGGMGIVYEAEQLALGRHVALKVLPARSVFDELQLERFHRESKAAARMNHANIVPVFDVGEYDGVHCYVMQFVPGLGLDLVLHELKQSRTEVGNTDETAADKAESSVEECEIKISDSSSAYRLPGQKELGAIAKCDHGYWQSIARIGSQVADALAYAHAQGILHRDIKPSNLLLDSSGTAWVTDFGLAKEIGSDNLTRTGDIVGTLKYMAPECLEGRSDERGDVYGLGATLYELLTLEAPFQATDRSTLIRQVMFGDPLPPSSVRPGIPLDLETIVLKSIARDPADRYLTANEMAADLNRFLDDRPIRARRHTRVEVAWRWCRRNPIIAGMAAIVSALLIVSAVAFLIAATVRGQRDAALASQVRAEAAERSALENLERAESAEREVRWRNHLAKAGLIRRNGGLGQRIDSIAEIEKALNLIDEHTPESRRELATELIADLALVDIKFEPGVSCSLANHVDLTPDFTHIAIGHPDGKIQYHRLQDGTELWTSHHDLTRVTQVLFSKDGQHLIVSGDSKTGKRVELIRASDGIRLWTRLCDSYHSFDFVHGHRQVLLGVPQKWILMDLLTGETLVEAPKNVRGHVLRVSPDGSEFCHQESTSSPLTFFSLPSFKQTGKWEAPEKYFQFAWHPFRREVAVGVDDGSVHVVKPGESVSHRQLRGQHGRGTSVAFSPDGRKLISNDWAGRFRLWDYESGRRLLQENINVEPLRFDKTGQQLGVIRDKEQAKIGSVIDSNVFKPLSRETGTVANTPTGAAWHPQGKWVVLSAVSTFEFHDLERNHKIGEVQQKGSQCLVFDEGQLWSRSDRVRTRSITEKDGAWEIGLPKVRNFPGLQHVDQMAATSSYRLFCNRNGAIVIPKDSSKPPVPLKPHYDCRFVAASPDGKLIATGSHWGIDVRIWKPNGELVTKLPIKASSSVTFSPDGKWLLTSGGGFRLWQVGTWEQVEFLGGKMHNQSGNFSPDSRLIAYSKRNVSHLYDIKTKTEIAQLIDPQPTSHCKHLFSPDGSQLLCMDTSAIWNIRQIRNELSKRGIDWDLPPLPQPEKNPDSKPVQMVFEQPKQNPSKSPEEIALAEFRAMEKAWKAKPGNALAQNNFAWTLVTTQRNELRDPQRALELVLQAQKQDPKNDLYVNTLGVVYYYVGRYRESVEILTSNLSESSDDGLAFDLYFIAMSYAGLEQTTEAKNHLLMANRWFDQQLAAGTLPGNYISELKHIRAEAQRLIEVSSGAGSGSR